MIKLIPQIAPLSSKVGSKIGLACAALALVLPGMAHAQTFGGMPTITPQNQTGKDSTTPEAKEEDKPDYVVVDTRRGKTGSYQSIQAAVDAVDWGGVVVVMPGDYHENLDIRKAVTIQGDRGPGASVRIIATRADKPCLNFEPFSDDSRALISNVEFRTAPSATQRPSTYDGLFNNEQDNSYDRIANSNAQGSAACIAIKSGIFTMKESTIDGGRVHNGSLIEITGGTAQLERNTITGGLDGVLVAQRSPLWDRTSLIDNNITENLYTGVHMTGVASVTASGNFIAGNGQGIVYNGEGDATIVANKILNNRGTGVLLGRDAKQILLRLNEIFENDGDGVKIYTANGLIENNDIRVKAGYSEIDISDQTGNLPKIINDVAPTAKSFVSRDEENDSDQYFFGR